MNVVLSPIEHADQMELLVAVSTEAGADSGREIGAIVPLKPTKVTLFTIIFAVRKTAFAI